MHDAVTVTYPFAFEPLASLVRHGGGEPVEALPPVALVSYVMRHVLRAVPGDPNMLPLARDRAG